MTPIDQFESATGKITLDELGKIFPSGMLSGEVMHILSNPAAAPIGDVRRMVAQIAREDADPRAERPKRSIHDVIECALMSRVYGSQGQQIDGILTDLQNAGYRVGEERRFMTDRQMASLSKTNDLERKARTLEGDNRLLEDQRDYLLHTMRAVTASLDGLPRGDGAFFVTLNRIVDRLRNASRASGAVSAATAAAAAEAMEDGPGRVRVPQEGEIRFTTPSGEYRGTARRVELKPGESADVTAGATERTMAEVAHRIEDDARGVRRLVLGDPNTRILHAIELIERLASLVGAIAGALEGDGELKIMSPLVMSYPTVNEIIERLNKLHIGGRR